MLLVGKNNEKLYGHRKVGRSILVLPRELWFFHARWTRIYLPLIFHCLRIESTSNKVCTENLMREGKKYAENSSNNKNHFKNVLFFIQSYVEWQRRQLALDSKQPWRRCPPHYSRPSAFQKAAASICPGASRNSLLETIGGGKKKGTPTNLPLRTPRVPRRRAPYTRIN